MNLRLKIAGIGLMSIEAPCGTGKRKLFEDGKTASNGPPAENQRCIAHYWLPGKCAELFLFDHDPEMNVRLKSRNSEPSEEKKRNDCVAT